MGKNLIFGVAVLAIVACSSTTLRGPAVVNRKIAQNAQAVPLTFGVPARSKNNPFTQIRQPIAGDLKIYGSYSAGCLAGAQQIPTSGRGFEVQRLSRNRYYGHPELISLLERAGQEFAERSTLLIGDLGQPAGGPMLGGHASHQIGLDADIWFYLLPPTAPFTNEMREKLYASSVLKKNYLEINEKAWRPIYGEEVLWFAAQPEVERVFVNAVIKKRLCAENPGDPRLIKVRPWSWHDDHFHVRLKCPADQVDCVPQEAPKNLECDEKDLAYWYSPKKLDELLHPKPETEPPKDIQLPLACRALIEP